MTKAEETLEHMAVNSPVRELVLNGNINAICLSAMQEQSIAFAEWVDDYHIRTSEGFWYNPNKPETFKGLTTSELYKLFNEL